MSNATDSPDATMALQSHYSLRWNNHQTHILQAFEALLHAEILVDVTLVCSETSLRAHKVVLSACSPFFERIFAEHPCKHPVIVLKDFPGREVAALIDFMYRGEVRVGREELPGLIRAAESLQVRGLASSEPRPASPPETPTGTDMLVEPSTPEGARQDSPLDEDNLETTATRIDTRGGIIQRDNRLPHMGHLNFSVRDLRDLCNSPLMPRRKQARPRRRSGELVPQDLSRPHNPRTPSPPSSLNFPTPLTTANNNNNNTSSSNNNTTSPDNNQDREEMAENLSLKRPNSRLTVSPTDNNKNIKIEREQTCSPRCSPLIGTSLHDLPPVGLSAMSGLSLTPSHQHSEYLTSLGQLGQLAAQWLPSHPSQLQQSHGAMVGGHQTREESPHQQHNRLQNSNPYQRESSQCRDEQDTLPSMRSVAVFPIDGMSPVGGSLFPHGGPLDRGSLLTDLHDSFKPETLHGLFGSPNLGHHPSGKKSKKHRGGGDAGVARRWSEHGRGGMPIGRPKGQHSAPRGGPPRSWTNAELTIALQHVWNKQMTTSQASRMFSIPYNSLLMYVRGKYGKSLKLEQLRRDCTGTTTGEVMNSLNNNVKAIQGNQQQSQMNNPLTGLPHPADEANYPHHSLLGANLTQGFYPDYSTAFPVPVNMVHLLPPSEQKIMEHSSIGNPGTAIGMSSSINAGLNLPQRARSNASPNSNDDLCQDMSRSPSPIDNNHHDNSISTINITTTSQNSATINNNPQTTQSAPALLQQNGSD